MCMLISTPIHLLLLSGTMEELKGAVSGGRGGRGGRGRKKGGKKGFKDTSAIVFGEGQLKEVVGIHSLRVTIPFWNR